MPRVTTYLNFPGNAAEALEHYKKAFGTDYVAPLQRYGDMPPQAGQPELPAAVKTMVLHGALPILGGHVLMVSDSPDGISPVKLQMGNNVHINLEPDTRAEADRLFKALSEGGVVETPLQEMFWGAYYGTFTDRFGTHWMVNCMAQ